jgi:hypothetical protein
MSEDENAEQEALKLEVLEKLLADAHAFEARFKRKAFVEVAHALKIPPTPANLNRLGLRLVPFFYAFYENCSGRRQSRRGGADQLRRLRDAAKLLSSSEALILMPWDIGCDEQFFETATKLARLWDADLERLERALAKPGRRRNTAFYRLIADLAWMYERQTRSRAGAPWGWQPGKSGSRGEFNAFVIAVWRCLMTNIREVHGE